MHEIRLTAQLVHPNIVPVLDSGELDGRPYFVLPFMEGGTLRTRLARERQLPLEDVIALGITIAGALQFAHGHGLIHRDVKPENILFSDGVPCLADFGTARALERATSDPTTSTGIVRGTPAYMSPEQASGEHEYDGRSDIYSLACVLYEAVAGIQPFVGPTTQAVISQRLTHAPRPVSVYRPTVPTELEEVLAKATALVPADRYQSAGELAGALEAVVPALSRPRRSPRSGMRRKALMAGAAAIALVSIGAFWLKPTQLNRNDWILVADFTGPKEDAEMAGVVRDLATQALKQSRFVQVFDRRQLNDVMRHASIPETTHVTPSRARELAVRGSVSAVLEGDLQRADSGQYRLAMYLTRAGDGSSIASVAAKTTDRDMTSTVQALVHELRNKVGERRGEISATRPLRDVTTPSFAAFTRYTAALDVVGQRGDFVRSNALLKEAIAIDTGFASAWSNLATNYIGLRQLDSARAAMAKALSLPDRLSPSEEYRLKGDVAYFIDHDVSGAIKWYDRYLEEQPQSTGGHTNRGIFKTALGRYEEALPDLLLGTKSPFGTGALQIQLLNYGGALVVVGRYDEARRVADSLTGMPKQFLEVMIPTAESRWAAAERAAAAAADSATTPTVYRINALTSWAGALAAQGRVQQADSLLAAAVVSAGSKGSFARWFTRAQLELAIARGGAIGPAANLVRNDTTPAAAVLRALWSSVAGDTVAARAFIRKAGPLRPAQVASLGTEPQLIESWIDIAAHRPRNAVDRLGAIALRGENEPTLLDRPDSFILRWTVAAAYEQLGNADSAKAYYRLIVQPTNMPPTHLSLRGILAPAAQQRLTILERRAP